MSEIPLYEDGCEDGMSPSLRVLSFHPGGNPEANLKSIFHRYHLREVVFEWALTQETVYLPLGCLKGGISLD